MKSRKKGFKNAKKLEMVVIGTLCNKARWRETNDRIRMARR